MFFKTIRMGMLAAGILTGALTTQLFAQRGGGGGGRDSGPNIPTTPLGGATRFERLSDVLKLNKEQKKDVRATLDDAQKQATPIHDRMMKGRQAIAEAVAGAKSQDEIDQLVSANAALDAQIAGIELKAFAAIYKGLDTDQQTRTAAVFTMMKGLFNGKNWNSPE
jgi:Heavy-metal resistance